MTIEHEQVFVKMALDAWNSHLARAEKLFNELTDEQLMAEVAPGRNRGVYLLGHLIGVHDGMLPLLGFGEKLYPQLEAVFLSNPDKSELELPALAEIRKYWNEVNAALKSHIEKLTADEWFAKHTAVSADDFVKEPHRNKMNVIISRTNHLNYHLGQLVFLK